MGLLDGKVAVVTGAGRGVGRSEALALAAEGARVVVNDLGASMDGSGKNSAAADQTVKDIEKAGGQAAADYSDISQVEGVDSLIWTALNKFGRLDVLINNAGILRDRTLLNMSLEDWEAVAGVHSRGAFLCTRAAARVMKSQGDGGVIINTTSMSGLIGNFGQANYGHAKAGIYGFTKVAAMELGRYGIRVHAVSPNAVTRMTENLPGLTGMTEKIMSPDALGPLVVFLASDLSADLTGLVIGAQGGAMGSKVYEFKMTVSEGYKKADGLPTAQDIADNLKDVLVDLPDLDIITVGGFD